MLLQLTKLLTRQRASYVEDEGDTATVPTCPVSIAKDAIRCFNPRNEGKPGTRITFKDGGGYAVAESYDRVLAYYETGVLPSNVAQIGNA